MCARAATSSGEAAGMLVNAKNDRIWIPFVTRATAGNSIGLQDHSRRRKEHKVTSLYYHARSMGNEEQGYSKKDDRIHAQAKKAPHSQFDSMHQCRQTPNDHIEKLRAGEHGIQHGWGRGKRVTPRRPAREHPGDPSRAQRSSGIACWRAQRAPSAVGLVGDVVPQDDVRSGSSTSRIPTSFAKQWGFEWEFH